MAKPIVPLALTRRVVTGPLSAGSVSTVHDTADAGAGAASLNRSNGGTRPID